MRTKVKTPNGILYFVSYLLLYPMLKLLFRLRVERGAYRPPEGPFIVVSNHQSFMDFALAMLTVYPCRVNAVAARKFFFFRPLNRLLPLMGCIPKSLFDPDPRSIMGMMSVLKRGGRVLLFPEGRCSVAGAYMGMHKSTGKLIKKLCVPVVSCRIEGSYNAMPFWRKGMRRGRIQVRLTNLLGSEDIRAISADAICQKIDASLGGPTPAPERPLLVFRQKHLAEGLQNILYYCPACGREFTLETQGNSIFCTACGNTAVIDTAMNLLPAQGSTAPHSVQDWYRQQSLYEMRRLRADMEPVAVPVMLHMAQGPGKGVGPCGQGRLVLDPRGWHYKGSLRGRPAQLFFPIDTVPALPFDPKDDFQIYAHGEYYMFTLDDPRAYSKYATLGECVYWRFATPVQMTPGCESGFVYPLTPGPTGL